MSRKLNSDRSESPIFKSIGNFYFFTQPRPIADVGGSSSRNSIKEFCFISLALIISSNFAPQFPIESGTMRLHGRDIFVDCGAKNNLSACF